MFIIAEKRKNVKAWYLLLLVVVTILWFKQTLGQNFTQGSIFSFLGIIVVAAYLLDIVFKSAGGRVLGLVDKGDLPVDAPEQEARGLNIFGFKLSPVQADVAIGLTLSAFFIYSSMVYGIQWAGIPKITFAADQTSKAFWTGLVAPLENNLAAIVALTTSSLALWYFYGKKGEKSDSFTAYALIIFGILFGAWFMMRLHDAVYGLNAEAMKSVFIFFLTGISVSIWRKNTIAFDILHFAWNFTVVYSALNVALGFSIAL